MSAPKTAFLSSDLLRETRTLLTGGEGDTRAPAAKGVAPAAAEPARERLYLQYGMKVLAMLEAARDPLSDREMFDQIRDGEFAQFRIALAEMLHRGLIERAGRDAVFGDQHYILAPRPA